jgi:aminomethyltransferase
MQDLLRTPLYNEHLRLKAGMVEFGGWEMPIQYTGILAEYQACRQSAALFDICHMGEFYFKGNIEKSGIEQAVSTRISKISEGRCRYSLMLSGNGSILDDLIIYRLSDEELMMVVNAGTKDSDFSHIKNFLSPSVIFNDISPETAKLDLQGPLSREALSVLIPQGGIENLKYYSFSKFDIGGSGAKALISRTGYTGELGFEIYIDSKIAADVWERLLRDKRIRPAGLGARDILRLEAGYCLYGHDIGEWTDPIEAGLESFVDYSKDFMGKEALLARRESGALKRKIAFIAGSRRTARQDYEIYSGDSRIGSVTSGVFSPALSRGIGFGYVSPEYSKTGEKLLIRHENIEIDAEISELPFYKNGSLRK